MIRQKRSTILSFVLVITLCFPQLINAKPLDKHNEIKQSTMAVIGPIGNKVFYESDILTNGLNAVNYCNGQGLKPGKLNNMEEVRFLQSMRPNTALWTGGAVTGQESSASRFAFEWNDGSSIPDDFTYRHVSAAWICLYYYSNVLYTGQCLGEYQRKVLCERS